MPDLKYFLSVHHLGKEGTGAVSQAVPPDSRSWRSPVAKTLWIAFAVH